MNIWYSIRESSTGVVERQTANHTHTFPLIYYWNSDFNVRLWESIGTNRAYTLFGSFTSSSWWIWSVHTSLNLSFGFFVEIIRSIWSEQFVKYITSNCTVHANFNGDGLFPRTCQEGSLIKFVRHRLFFNFHITTDTFILWWYNIHDIWYSTRRGE